MPRAKTKTEEEKRERSRAYQRAYYYAHQDAIREYAKKWTLEHSEKIKEYHHQYYLRRKAFYEAQGTTIYQVNKERLDEGVRRYNKANRDKINQRKRELYRQKKRITDPNQLATLFKDPNAAAAYKWLAERNKKQES